MSLPTEPLTAVIEKSIPFVANTQVAVEELARGYTRMRMPLANNQNHVGSMYAGALFTLAELPGGAIFLSSFDTRRFYPVVRDLSLRFRRPALSDVSVEVRVGEDFLRRIEAEAQAQGKSDYEWDCELKDSEGIVVAVGVCKYQLRRIGS